MRENLVKTVQNFPSPVGTIPWCNIFHASTSVSASPPFTMVSILCRKASCDMGSPSSSIACTWHTRTGNRAIMRGGLNLRGAPPPTVVSALFMSSVPGTFKSKVSGNLDHPHTAIRDHLWSLSRDTFRSGKKACRGLKVGFCASTFTTFPSKMMLVSGGTPLTHG